MKDFRKPETGKIYARELRSDYIDSDIYFSEEDACQMQLWVGGNREFVEWNAELTDKAYNALDNYGCFTDECCEDEEPDMRDFVREYLGEDWSKTPEKYDKIKEICEYYINCPKSDMYDCMAQILTLIHNKPFKSGAFTGCSQGEYVEYICPEETDEKLLNYIEAVFFGTGTEYQVTLSHFETAPDFEDPDLDVCLYYTTETWNAQRAKEDLASQLGIDPSELVLLQIKDEHRFVKYDYEEV